MKKSYLLLCIVFCLFAGCTTPGNLQTDLKTLDKQIENYNSNQNYEEAEHLLLEVLEIRKKLPPQGRHPDYAASLNKLGEVYSNMGQWDKAEPFILQALEIRKKLPPQGRHPDYAHSLNYLAVLYLSMGNFNKAETIILQAVEIGKSLPPEGKHPYYASSLNNLAGLYWFMGAYNKSEPLFLQAMEIWKSLPPAGKHPDYALSLDNLAKIYLLMGHYNEAQPLYLEALEIKKNLPPEKTHPDYATTLNDLGILYMNMGNYDKAKPLYLEALKIRKNLAPKGKHPGYAATLNDLATLYLKMRNYNNAEPLFTQAIEIRKILPPAGKHPEYALSLDNLATLYLKMRNYNNAEPLFTQAMEIRKNLPPAGKHPDYAVSLNNLANLYESMGNYNKAEPLFTQAMEICKIQAPAGKHPEYALSMNNLAALYLEMKNYNNAEPLLLGAIEIWKNLPPAGKHPHYALSLKNLAKFYEDMGNYSNAEPLYLQAMEIQTTLLPVGKHPEYASSMNNLALLYEAMGNYQKAEPYLLESLDISREHLRNNFSNLSEKEKELFLSTLAGRFEQFYSLLERRLPSNPELAGNAADLQLFSKAILFRSSKAIRRRILRSGDTSLIKDYDSWLLLRRQISKARELTAEQQAARLMDLEALEKEANSLEKSLASRSQEYRLAYEQKEDTWQDIRSALAPGEAAVNLVRYRLYDKGWTETVHYAVIITKADSSIPEIFFMKNGNIIEEEISLLYRNFMEATAENAFAMEDRKKFDVLYTKLWEPIAEKLKNIHRVYFVPDGVFNLINPETLKDPEGLWLGEKLEIIRVTALQDIIKKPGSPRKVMNPPLLMGYPLYDIDEETHRLTVKHQVAETVEPGYEKITYRGAGSPQLLPGTKAEVNTLAELLTEKGEKVDLRLGEAALEEYIKVTESPRILHLATHGFFQQDSLPRESGKTFTGTDDPMLRSGLLFTGAARTLQGAETPADMENGILTAKEALNLNLDNTELVVLSACETGLGVVKNGEGVYGLQRAFLMAGAEGVLMSLWKVNDQATRDFMVAFYTHWLEGNSKREAYNTAIARMKEKYPAPFYWGSFVLVGGNSYLD